jgi:O-methyltransferase involved in polyketide biosynthesis
VSIAASVIEGDWPAAVARAADGPYFFICEGMLMYLDVEHVRALLVRLADHFGPTEIAFDSIAPSVVRHQQLHDSMRHMMDAPFRWGIDDVRFIEQWDPRVAVREVATLPDIARQFRDRVPLAQRLACLFVERALPTFAGAYRLSRVGVGA